MNGNERENRDKQVDTLGCPLSPDAVEAAIAEKLEQGHAEEERFGFAATVANTTPPVDEGFRRTLRASIVAEAAQTMEERRPMRTISDRGQEMNTRRPYRILRLAFALSVTAALLAFVFVTPWGQTLAQNALRFFVRTDNITFPLQSSQMVTPDPSAPTAQPPAPLVSIAEAERQTGLDIAELPFVPDGFNYLGARVYGNTVRIEYEAQGGGGSLIIRQSPEGFAQSEWDQVPEHAIVPMKIGELDGEFARGTFVVYPGDANATWDPDVPILRMRWVDDGIWFEMTKFGDVEAIEYLDQAHLAQLAAGMGGRAPVANAGPQVAPEDIDALARRLNEEPDPRTVAVFPADYAPALVEHIQHEVVPLAVGDDLAPAAVQAALGAALPRSGLVDVVLVDQDGGEMVKRVRASLERQLYRLYRGPGDSSAETFGALERKQYVAGYVSGIGLVEKDPTLRVLAEPVTLTRSDLTVEVDHALLYSERTVIHYRVESASTYPFAEPGDDICLEYAYLRLPDGSTLQPQPMGDGKAFEAGYEFATSFTDPIPADVTQATLIIPCLLDSVRGAAPENWELALRFIPAPPDMDLSPVYEATDVQPATDQGIKIDLAYVVAEENGYIFNFGLTWDRDGGHSPALYPGSLHVTDATGQKILLSSAGGRPPMANQAPEPFTFRTSEMPAPGPLTLNLETIRASFPVHDVSFTFDPGSDPQPDQVWTLDEHFSVAGYEWDITSARMVVQDGGSTAGEVEGFEFTMQSADPGMMVELLDTAYPLAACETGFPQGAVFSSTLTYENGIPAGPITVTVSQVSVLIPGDWQIRWAPPAEQVTGPATLQPIGVTFENGIELVEAGVIDDPKSGEPLRVALEWRTETPVDDPVMVFTHLMCEGQLVAQRDAIPGNGEFPAPSWQPGEVIRDQFALQLPAELPVGECQIQVGIYNPTSGQRYSPIEPEGTPYVVIRQFTVNDAGQTL
jgi:hypothetical protein